MRERCSEYSEGAPLEYLERLEEDSGQACLLFVGVFSISGRVGFFNFGRVVVIYEVCGWRTFFVGAR